LLVNNSMQSSISKYRITKRVGGGSFGDIYLGVGANGEKVRRVCRRRVSFPATQSCRVFAVGFYGHEKVIQAKPTMAVLFRMERIHNTSKNKNVDSWSALLYC